uniref:Reverse transcriptase domain-containing protein n=1 Tax=Tanacetum cinerariifolium TaxID=118510 RepID=A0A6L2MUV8_TANCI|nr:reverse transcriptase domain-containing protein [Tanacetum cinerariifolium]
MDDEPMWDADHVVTLTLGSAITIPETANEFAIKGSSNSNTDKIMARMDAMTLKINAQYKELQSNAKKAKPNLDKDDIPMSREEDAKFMQTFRMTHFTMITVSKTRIAIIGVRTNEQSANAFVKETFMDLKTQIKTIAKNHQSSIQNLETKFDRLADKQSGRPSGSLPSNTQPDLKGHNSKAYQPPQSRNEHELISNKHKIEQISAAFLSEESSAMIQNKVSPKLGEPGSFLIPCNFNKTFSCNALADLGASINLMPYSLYAKLSLKTLKPTKMIVRLADISFQYPVGIAENMLVEKQLNLGVGTERMIFNIDSAMKHSYSNDDTCFSIDVINEILEEDFDALLDEEPLTNLELKPLPDNLEYVILEEPSFLHVIISSQLSKEKKDKLVSVLRKHKQAFAWKITYIPSICPSFCKYKIQLLDNKKPVVQKQRRLNPNIQEVVKKEIMKLLDTGIIYPIADSPWEKCHFMVKEGIVLRHKVSSAGLKVDRAKIDVMSKLPPLTNIKDTPFEFNDECQKTFELLKEKLTCAPVIVSPNWNISFELMCDASDFAVGAVLCQKDALRHLFKKQDAKPCLIRWILLLQEFDIEIKDRRGTDNVVTDHLSSLENDETSNDNEIDDNIPGKTLTEINTKDEPCGGGWRGIEMAAVVVVLEVAAARGGVWCGGSSISGDKKRFWFRPESSPEKFSDGGGWRAAGIMGERESHGSRCVFPTFPIVLRPFKTLCFFNYALILRQDYDITSSLRRGALQPQFWYTIKKVRGTNSYEFLLANKKCIVNAEVFRIILDICPRVEGVDFTDVLDDDNALTFLMDLGYKGSLNKHTNMFVDHMHQPWRTLAAIINKCLSRKLANIAYQIYHRKEKRSRRENMPYPRFTKIIINYFLKQHKSLTNLNHKHYHTIKDDMIIPPKKRKGKGLKGRKNVDNSHETVDVSEESEPKPEPVKKKFTSRRVIKKKVTLSADDNIIFDDPDVALELAKSFQSVVIQDTLSAPKSKSATSKLKLKGAQSLTLAEQEAADIMQALKESKKSGKRQPGVLNEDKDITEEKVILESGDKDDENNDVEKDDKDGDADDEDDDHVSGTQDADDEDEETESNEDDIYKYKIRVRKDKDVEMTDVEVEESDKGDEKVTDAAKEETKKTSEEKDDTKKIKLPPSSSSLSVSLGFGDQFLKISSDSSLASNVKDSADIDDSVLLDIPIQQETPQI